MISNELLLDGIAGSIMAERGDELETYPSINSSILHRGIPNRAAPFLLCHLFHRAGFGSEAWIDRILDTPENRRPPILVIHVNQRPYGTIPSRLALRKIVEARLPRPKAHLAAVEKEEPSATTEEYDLASGNRPPEHEP
jgi:hypothetical protein